MKFLKFLAKSKTALYLFRMFMLFLITLLTLVFISCTIIMFESATFLTDQNLSQFFGVAAEAVSLIKKVMLALLLLIVVGVFFYLLGIGQPKPKKEEDSSNGIVYWWCMSEGFSHSEATIISKIF